MFLLPVARSSDFLRRSKVPQSIAYKNMVHQT
jgi:hypothetical protein